MKIAAAFGKIDHTLQRAVNKLVEKPRRTLFFLLLLNLMIRGWGIGSSSLWFDEASQISMSLKGFNEIITDSLKWPNAPVYTLLLSVWIDLFGISEAAVRSLALIFGMGTLLVLFLLAKKHLNFLTALFASLLLSVSNLHLNYCQEVRSYTLVSLLVVSSFFLLLELLEKASFGRLACLAAVNTLLLYTHLTAILIFPAQLLYCLAARCCLRKTAYVFCSLLVPTLLLGFWLLNNTWFGGRESVWLEAPDLKDLAKMMVVFCNGNAPAAAYAASSLLALLYIKIKGNDKGAEDSFWSKLLLLVLWAIVPVIIMFIASIYYNPRFIPRYLLYSSLGIYLFTAYLISHRSIPYTLKILMGGVLVFAAGSQLNLAPEKLEDWREAVSYYKSQLKTEDSITILDRGWQYLPFSYYYNKQYFEHYGRTKQLLADEGIDLFYGKNTFRHSRIKKAKKVILILSHNKDSVQGYLLYDSLYPAFIEAGAPVRFRGIMIYTLERPRPKDEQ